MRKNDFIFYKKYLKNRDVKDKKILVSKTNDSYLIGPKIDKYFDEESFFRRIKSNSIYNSKIYKNILNKNRVSRLIIKFIKEIKSNEVIEIKKDGTKIIHKIVKVPGVK